MPLRHELPTHLAVEDRLLGNLTTTQALIVLSGGTATFGCWQQTAFLAPVARIGLALFLTVATLAVSLVRPQGRGLAVWLLILLRFAAFPKTTVWRPVLSEPAPAAATSSDAATFAPPLSWRPVQALSTAKPRQIAEAR